jgi:penicillin-binding protein 2
MKDPFIIYTNSSPKTKNRTLDWEESALDAQDSETEIFDSERSTYFLTWLWPLVILIFFTIFFRLFFLQIVKGESYRQVAENNRIRKQVILAPRGLIVDSFGKDVVENMAGFNLVAVPLDLQRNNLDDVLNKLQAVFGVNFDEAKNKILAAPKNSIQPLLLKQDLSLEQSILFETRSSEFVGFSVQKIPIRKYLQPEAFSHVVGYTGPANQNDLRNNLKNKYDAQDFIGRSGIEAEYEDFLRGQNGQNLIEVDASGKVQSVLGTNSPKPGNTLILNIDSDLQQKLYSELRGRLGNVRAAAVAMEPKTGKILALVSLPGYDNNQFAHGIKNEEYKALIADKNLPLFNRVISGTYPPGSTVKPMVAAAALSEGVVTESTIIYDRGVLVIPNQYNPEVSYNFYGWKREGLGAMDIKSAIANSSDIYFYTVAGGHPKSPIKPLGPVKLAEYYKKFNLGQITGIDLPGEKPGVVADPDWKSKYFKNDPVLSKWYLGDTYHIGIGQGDMLATPLQVAEWTSIIANNGVGMKPKILNAVKDEFGKEIYKNESEILVKEFIKPEYLKIVQEGMRQTILEGSGRQLAGLPISSAGKTGTSQFDGSDPSRTHAWFTAYAPFENPEIVITVLAEAGGEGHAAAVPVAKNVLDWWARNRFKK